MGRGIGLVISILIFFVAIAVAFQAGMSVGGQVGSNAGAPYWVGHPFGWGFGLGFGLLFPILFIALIVGLMSAFRGGHLVRCRTGADRHAPGGATRRALSGGGRSSALRLPNPVTWFEIIGKDAHKLQAFYRDVFGWKLGEPSAKEFGYYSQLDNEGKGIAGGVGGAGEQGGGARVSVYIEVDDPDAYLKKAEAKGGKTLMPTTTILPGTTIALFSDPEGNVTGLLKAGG